jgi:hypothetical protein
MLPDRRGAVKAVSKVSATGKDRPMLKPVNLGAWFDRELRTVLIEVLRELGGDPMWPVRHWR